MRIVITQDWGRPYTIEWSDRAWRAEWEAVLMEKIRAAVVRQAAVNTLILECEGGNEFYS